ncbi:SGNH/GDSL hydrolase family protein [Roseovarius mucosus]|uniref:SGNH/GDSL hydrolase family protein n=1 Tax=Roseovarius mucosus TaxID=215743 RepID=UPI0027E461BF|nr:hypothetical protein [Roseovarius mucosus]
MATQDEQRYNHIMPFSHLETRKIVSKPRLMFRPDPVLGWRLSPEHTVRVAFRSGIFQNIAADGWRYVPGSQTAQGPRVAIYGCSFTYGTGLSDDETFTALLQRDMPDVQILNRGIGGHGTVQNLLQLRRDIAAGTMDAAVFAMISDHRFRNIAHPQRMRQYLSEDWYKLRVEHVPVARFDGKGQLQIVYREIWQPALRDVEFGVFLPDDHMINLATCAVLGMVCETAKAASIPLQIVMLDALDPDFNSAVFSRFPEATDISNPHDRDHTFLPRDIHPNARANSLFADRLQPLIRRLIGTDLGRRSDQ